MRRLSYAVMASGLALGLCASSPVLAQTRPSSSELEDLKQEIQKLQDRLRRLEEAQRPAPPPVAAQAPPPAPAPPGEREISLERGSLLETIGLPRPEIGGLRISGFSVGSFSYNSRLQMVPEFAGSIPALADPGRSNFRFDKFSLGISKTFAPWLSAGAVMEVASARDRHSHGFDPAFGCPGTGVCIERFGTEAAETRVELHRFHVTGIAPLGNGLALSFGRFDIPFGIERDDEPLLLTATTSEVFRFGRPNSLTGFQTSYHFNPWLDVSAWVANRWESETTDDPFDDNNRDKSFGGRIGFTPIQGKGLLNFGFGGFWGPEQDDNTASKRWVLDFDFTWTPIPRLLLAGEAIYGGEDNRAFRQRGIPFPAPAVGNMDVNWWGFYLLAHYDLYDWLGLSFRYGYFDDMDAARTGVKQKLQSWTFVPIIHLSRLIPDLRPLSATYARTRHPIDWVNLKVEYRFNRSNRPVFSDVQPGAPITAADKTSHQVQVQLDVSF